MTRTTFIAIAASLAPLFTTAHAETISLKPMQGASLALGSEHAVNYFWNNNGRCNLVVAAAGEPNWDANGSLSVTRFESLIPAGKSANYSGSIKFTCAADAQSMLVERVREVAESAE